MTAFYSQILLSEPLYKALRDLDATDEAKHLDPARRRYLTKTLADFRRNGAELDAAGKKRLGDIDVALSELTLKFAQNVVDATSAFELARRGVRGRSASPASPRARSRPRRRAPRRRARRAIASRSRRRRTGR